MVIRISEDTDDPVTEALQEPANKVQDVVKMELHEIVEENTKAIKDLRSNLEEKDRKIIYLEEKIVALEHYQKENCLKSVDVEVQVIKDSDIIRIEVTKKLVMNKV